ETDARIAAGMSPAEARRTALRDFGGIERHKERARDERGFRALDETLRDARYSLRLLRRNRGYAASAILTFALGIGLATSMFSVVRGVLFHPLPYREPDRLAVLWGESPSGSSHE